jgi:hypothetical protein
MASAFDKQHSSRPNVNQILAYLGGGATVVSTNFGTATQQIRVVSEVQGWLSIGASTTATNSSNPATSDQHQCSGHRRRRYDRHRKRSVVEDRHCHPGDITVQLNPQLGLCELVGELRDRVRYRSPALLP